MKKPKSVTTTFEEYRIGKILGEGGSGTVYTAVDDEGNVFAAKFLDPAKATTDKLKRFKNEIAFCRNARHPNIVVVTDNGITPDGIPFFVMKCYDDSLRSVVGKLASDDVMTIYEKILDGVEAAHKLRVTHRDLKPENILISNGHVDLVLADFGIARFEQEDLFTAVETKHNARLANFQYAAPEQRVRDREVDERADIYALGLILNELITGEIPQGTNFKLIGGVIEGLSYLDGVVEKMLAQDPNARFQSIEEIKYELIALGREHIALQKLNKTERIVVPKSEIDDPLVDDPMQIVDVDWEEQVLKIKLNHQIPPAWQWALNNMGGHTAIMGKGPERFQFQADIAMISSSTNEAQQIVDHFKDWLPRANQVYENKLKLDLENEERRQRGAIEAQAKKERERTEVLGKLKF